MVYILILVSVYASSQQIPIVNHSYLNNFSFNPATAGLTGKTRAFLVRNERFKTFGNGLVNNYLTVDGFHEDWNSGLGLELYQQNFGIQKQLGFSGAYSYRIKLSKLKVHELRFGVKLGATDFSINNNDIFLYQPQDPFLNQLNQQKLTLNGSAGLNYTIQRFNLGFSVPQLLGNRVNYSDSTTRGFYQMERHYITHLNYTFNPLFGNQITFQPNAIIRYAPSIPLQYEAGLTVNWNEFAWIRGAYKSDYASEISVGIRLFNSIIVGYSYEMPIAAGKEFIPNNGHEFLLGFEFGNSESQRIKDDLGSLPKRDTLTFEEEHRAVDVSTIDLSKEEQIKELLAKNLRQKQINDSLKLTLNSTHNDTILHQFTANNNYIKVLQEQQSAIDSLIASLRRTNEKVAQITTDNFKLNNRVVKQDRVIDSLLNSKEKVIFKTSDYSSFEKEITKLSKSNAKKQREIDSLIYLNNNFENTPSLDLSELEKEIAQLNTINLKQERKIDSLLNTKSKTQVKQNVDLSVLEREIKLLNKNNLAQQRKIDSLLNSKNKTQVTPNVDLSELEREMELLNKNNLTQQREIDSLLNSKNKTQVTPNVDLSELEREIELLNKNNLTQQREIDSLLNHINLLEQNIAILYNKKSKKRKKKSTNQVSIAELNERLNLKKLVDSLLFVSKSKQNQLDDLMVDNLKQTLEIDSLELLLRQIDADSYKKTDSILSLKRQLIAFQTSKNENFNSKPVEIRNLKNKVVQENTDGFLSEEETNRIIKNNQGKVQNSTLKDYFIELTGVDSPKGSYIVVGAYQDIKRAKNVLKDAQKDYPETRIIFNKRNSLNYIVVMYSVNLSKTVAEVSSTQRLGYDRAWVLNYDKK